VNRLPGAAHKTQVKLQSPEYEKNVRRMVEMLKSIKSEEEKIRQGRYWKKNWRRLKDADRQQYLHREMRRSQCFCCH